MARSAKNRGIEGNGSTGSRGDWRCRVTAMVVAVASVAGALLGGCDRHPARSFRVIRLLDHIDAAEVDTPREVPPPRTEFVERFAQPSPSTRFVGATQLRGVFPALVRSDAASEDLRFSAEGLEVPPWSVATYTFPVRRGDSFIFSADMDRESSVGGALRLVANHHEEIGVGDYDADWVGRVVRNRIKSTQMIALGAEAAASEVARYESAITVGKGVHEYTLVVMASAKPLRLLSFEVARLRRREMLMRSDGESSDPRVRRVEVDEVTREALLMKDPGSVTFTVGAWNRSSRLRFALAPLRYRSGAELTLSVEVSAGDRELVASTLTYGGEGDWEEWEIVLPPVDDGSDGVVSFDVASSASCEGVALAHPTIEVEPPAVENLPPDVVLISMDTVRADRLSIYGGLDVVSPSLEELAATSVVFDQAISVAAWTLPSHTSVFSGVLPARHGVVGIESSLPQGNPALLARQFRAHGYETVAFTGGGYVHPDFGFADGFECYGTRDPCNPYGAMGEDDLVDATVRRRLLAKLKEERWRPRFFFVHSYMAHNYFAFPEDLDAVGADRDVANDLQAGIVQSDLHVMLDQAKRLATDDVGVADVRRVYDATVRAMDRLVGEVVAAVRSDRGADRSIIVIFSDHGEELFEHGRIGHGGGVVEELVHVPLLMYVPGVAPSRVGEAVSLVDIAPTLRELCGLESHVTDGRSLVDVLQGVPLPPRASIAESGSPDEMRYALRSADLKFVVEQRRAPDGTLQFTSRQLFRVDQDPTEDHDLAPTEPDLVQRMEEALNTRLAPSRATPWTSRSGPLTEERRRQLKQLGYLGDDH